MPPSGCAARRTELAALEVFEAGKPWEQADADVCEAIDFCEYYGREMLRLDAAAADRCSRRRASATALVYQGKGVGVVIAPWNFPLAIPTRHDRRRARRRQPRDPQAGRADAGDRVRSLVEALRAGGLPAGVLQFLPGLGEEVGARLVEHPDVAVIVFTGSKAVGLHINEIGRACTGPASAT